ncbi:hypothetical protein [Acidovorax sp. A1169]|uniref:hypothetical protein n=1 Tax=Acidovorax sp. A1169 TaxID=3059524 RepID=UPI002737D271|nr:hypothetical protein [Acidovorax sp. A1169]MDP4074728.1 hypothetical protein [Acidovorax sp. A1169]
MQPAFSLPDLAMLLRDGGVMKQGKGANVLAGPLSALHYFLKELRACPAQARQRWSADFDAPLSRLSVIFT